jgi:hypothetical protein
MSQESMQAVIDAEVLLMEQENDPNAVGSLADRLAKRLDDHCIQEVVSEAVPLSCWAVLAIECPPSGTVNGVCDVRPHFTCRSRLLRLMFSIWEVVPH